MQTFMNLPKSFCHPMPFQPPKLNEYKHPYQIDMSALNLLSSTANVPLPLPHYFPVVHFHLTGPSGPSGQPVAHQSPSDPSTIMPVPSMVLHPPAQSSTSHETVERTSPIETVERQKKPRGAPRKPRENKNAKPVFWTPEEHTKFLEGLEKFGLKESLGPSGADLMAMYMGNRTRMQIRSHAQKYYAAKVKTAP